VKILLTLPFIPILLCGCDRVPPGGTYCTWEGEKPIYCARVNPYCGVKGEKCGVGRCCSEPPTKKRPPIHERPGGIDNDHGNHPHHQAPEAKGA